LRSRGVMTAIGSASKNTAMILERLGIAGLFDVVIDGTRTKKAKPDPEVFSLAAQSLGIHPRDCVVFEDAVAGVQAAHRGGMGVVGIGRPDKLGEADAIVSGLAQLMTLTAAQV